MTLVRQTIFYIATVLINFSNPTFSQIYEGTPTHPSSAYLQACSAEQIAELHTRATTATCSSGQNYGKFPKVTVYSDGCAMNACVECGSYDIYIGEGKCFKPRFHAVVTQRNPEPKFCAGNPIDIVNGKKFQTEIDIHPIRKGQAEFYRVYSNSHNATGGQWYNPYQKYLRPITQNSTNILRAKSTGYATRQAACEQGFNEIKTQINDSWTVGTTAILVNTCSIVRWNGAAGTTLLNLHIVADGQEYSDKAFAHGVQLVREDGSILEFRMTLDVNGMQTYEAFEGELGQLIHVNHNNQIAWRFFNKSGDIEEYGRNGKLISIASRNGLKQELFYDQFSGLLTHVKDSTNREIKFAYIGGKINSVTTGGNITTSYSYNSLGLIQQVTRPDNTTRIYHYEDARFPTFLTGITDERGIRYATWSYNAAGLGVFSEHAGGVDKTQFSFNPDGSTTVTNALNAQTNYKIKKDDSGVKQIISSTIAPTQNIESATTTYSQSMGYHHCTTDAKGIAICENKSNGVRTDDRKYLDTTFRKFYSTYYLWDPQKNAIGQIVEGEYRKPGRLTDFIYDDKGRLKQKTIRTTDEIVRISW